MNRNWWDKECIDNYLKKCESGEWNEVTFRYASTLANGYFFRFIHTHYKSDDRERIFARMREILSSSEKEIRERIRESGFFILEIPVLTPVQMIYIEEELNSPNLGLARSKYLANQHGNFPSFKFRIYLNKKKDEFVIFPIPSEAPLEVIK